MERSSENLNLRPILSVDLALKDYRDIGAVKLQANNGEVYCELISIPLQRKPSPERLAEFLVEFCVRAKIGTLLLDGPQGWKSENNALIHSRICERELNTPAKSGLPGCVKPGAYLPFVEFSVEVFDELSRWGWHRLSSAELLSASDDRGKIAVESFPLSAWRALSIPALPAKSKARPSALTAALDALGLRTPLRVSGTPNHDELQALVAGFAGLALQLPRRDRYSVAGVTPVLEGGIWREGFIVNAVGSLNYASYNSRDSLDR